MKIIMILVGVAVFVVLVSLLVAYICFRMGFYISPREKRKNARFSIPPGEIYEPFREKMEQWNHQTRAMPQRQYSIRSFDGLKLSGKYFEYAPGATVELMFHGYRGSAERDLCGGVLRAFALGRNVLIVDQRASSNSDGHVITFGVNESRDCISWLDFMVKEFGPDVKIVLTGISMGAATVLMAAARGLPSNVVGILADCGYNSAKDIMKKTIREMKLPPNLMYPFARLGARVYGKFDLEELSPEEAMKNCPVPVIFFHGDADDFVPSWMSQRNYEACSAPKELVIVPGAGHGLCYPVDPDGYLKAMAKFFTENGVPTQILGD